MIRTSESIAKLAPALVAAQAAMRNAPKETRGQVGNAIRYYTDLPTLTDLVRPILAACELAYVQFPCNSLTGHVGLCTRLVHSSGEWLEDEFSMPTGQGAQGVGSALSYSRRYALMAVLGIAADDDDGVAASQGQPTTRKRSAAATEPKGRTVTAAQLTKLGASFSDNKITDREARLAYVAEIVGHPVTTSKDLTTREAGTVIDALEERLGRLNLDQVPPPGDHDA